MIIDKLKDLSPFSASSSSMLDEGDSVPEFHAMNQEEERVNSADIRNAVVYFYPRAGTPGCTKEACKFSDAIQSFNDLDYKVYGVSTDSVEAQKSFHDDEGLEFDLIADFDQKVAEKFGVLTKSGFAERTTFVIEDSVIVKRFRKVDPEEHVEEVVEYLKQR
jgi:peroxiredoxin Q/BCP